MATDFSFVKPEGWVALKPNFEHAEKKLKRRVEKKDFGAEQGEKLSKLMKEKYDRWSRGEGKSGKEDVTVMQQREKAPSKKFASAMQRLAYLGRLALEELTSYVLDGTLQNAAVFQQALDLNKTSVPEYFKLLSERISEPEFFGKVADGAGMMPGELVRALSKKFGDWGFEAEVKPAIDAARMVDYPRTPKAPASPQSPAAPTPETTPAVPGEQVTDEEPSAQAPGALPAKPAWATVEPQPWPKDIVVPPPSSFGPRFRWYVQYSPKDGSGAMRGGVVDGLNEHQIYAFYEQLEKNYTVNNCRAIAKEEGQGWKPLPGARAPSAPAAKQKPGHTGREQQAPGRMDAFDEGDPKAYHWDFKYQNQSGHVGEEHLELAGAQVRRKLKMYERQGLKVLEMVNRDVSAAVAPTPAVPGEPVTDEAPAPASSAPASRSKVETPDPSDPQLYRWHFKVQIGNGPTKDMSEDLTGAQAEARLKEYPPMGIKVLELTKMSIVNTASIVVLDSDLRFAADSEVEEKFPAGTPIIFLEDVNLKFDALSAHGQIKKNMTGKIKKAEEADYLIDIAGQMYRLPRLVAEHVMQEFAATVIPTDQQNAQAAGPEAAAPGAEATVPGASQPQAQPPAPKPQVQPARPAAPAPQPAAAAHGTVVTADGDATCAFVTAARMKDEESAHGWQSVFIDNVEESIPGFFEMGTGEMQKALSEYAYMLDEAEVTQKPSWGEADSLMGTRDGLVISWNSGLGYASINKKAADPDAGKGQLVRNPDGSPKVTEAATDGLVVTADDSPRRPSRGHEVENNNCDGAGPHVAGEVRLMPTGGDGNAILCKRCWSKEVVNRPIGQRQSWEKLKVYETGDGALSPLKSLKPSPLVSPEEEDPYRLHKTMGLPADTPKNPGETNALSPDQWAARIQDTEDQLLREKDPARQEKMRQKLQRMQQARLESGWKRVASGDKFIVDAGNTQILTPADKSQAPVNVGRYGVWAFDQSKGKHQVIESGDDLESLMAKHGVPQERVIPISKMRGAAAIGFDHAAGTVNPQGGDLATFEDLHTILKDSDRNHIKFKDKNDANNKPASALPNQTAAVQQKGFADLLLLIESGAPGIPSEIGKRLYRADGAVSRITV